MTPGQATPRLPDGTVALLPDASVTGLAVLGVAADAHQPEALLHQVVEHGLVLIGRQSVPGLPGGPSRSSQTALNLDPVPSL